MPGEITESLGGGISPLVESALRSNFVIKTFIDQQRVHEHWLLPVRRHRALGALVGPALRAIGFRAPRNVVYGKCGRDAAEPLSTARSNIRRRSYRLEETSPI